MMKTRPDQDHAAKARTVQAVKVTMRAKKKSQWKTKEMENEMKKKNAQIRNMQ